MREIINIQVGNGGNQIGNSFWESLLLEHRIVQKKDIKVEIKDYQQECIQVYFEETKEGQYKARSIQVDSDPSQFIETSSIANTILKKNSSIVGQSSASNSFSKGFYELDIEDQVFEVIRKEVEASESLQGFQLMRSLGGGTGSGFGDKILTQLKDQYANKLITNFCILPTEGVNDILVEPYNTVLSLKGISENSDLCFPFHNGALYSILMKQMGVKQPTNGNLNQIIQRSLSGATSSWRFPSEVNNDMRKLSMNIIPYSSLNFVNIGLAPLTENIYIENDISYLEQIVSILSSNKNIMNQSKNINKNIEFSNFQIFRTPSFDEEQIYDCCSKLQDQTTSYSEQNTLKSNMIYKCAQNFNNQQNESALKLSSGSSIKEVLQDLLARFNILFQRRAFIEIGYDQMSEFDFIEAQTSLTNIIQEYEQHEKSN